MLAHPAPGGSIVSVIGVAAWLLVACSPTHNWREVRPEGASAEVLLPCKAVQSRREVVIAGVPTTVRLAACTTAGHTWAVAEVLLLPTQDVALLMRALRDTAAANLQATTAAEGAAAAQWPPQAADRVPEAGLWRLTGRRPDGSAVQMQLGLAARGRSIVQLSVIGSTPASVEATETFLSSLRWLPA
jgi:hypothetical protein